jgi:hypothetical protein
MTMNDLLKQTRAVAADIYRMEADALREEARAIAEAAYATGTPKLESISNSPSIYNSDPIDNSVIAQAWVPHPRDTSPVASIQRKVINGWSRVEEK